MRILFVWTGLTSYMGDCWRELAGRRDVDLKVLVAVEGRNAQQIDFRQDDVLRGKVNGVLLSYGQSDKRLCRYTDGSYYLRRRFPFNLAIRPAKIRKDNPSEGHCPQFIFENASRGCCG